MKYSLLFLILVSFFSHLGHAQEIILSNVKEAKAYTTVLSGDMSLLAEKYFNKESVEACELYTAFNNKLNRTQVVGEFYFSTRVSYRLNWYKNPDVTLSDICAKPGEFVENIYEFLMNQSRSLAGWRYN
jgi:hypothetical protein